MDALRHKFSRSILLAVLLLAPFVCRPQNRDTDGPESAAARMGERLFLETRFAQFFFTNSGSNANYRLTSGDPVLTHLQTDRGPVSGPFRSQSMNCRTCHLVDELNATQGNRTYCDFTARSPVPLIGDGCTNTPRNSPILVDALFPRPTPLFLHLDGQFASARELIIQTLTGRNYGWKPTEYATALAHIAHIIRDDDGSGELARGKFGGGYSYTTIFDPSSDHPITKVHRLNVQYLLTGLAITNSADPGYVSDEKIIGDIATLIQVYLETLQFARDQNGNFTGSPFDVFLNKNKLPQHPAAGESSLQYGQRLLNLIQKLPDPQYVSDPADGHFNTHNQTFQFGPQELAGLKIFFAPGRENQRPYGHVGNCIACHSPPNFTDFLFHNNGAAQEEYDSIHGPGSFNHLNVPPLPKRQANYNAYLPQTTNHPHATGRFVTPPSRLHPDEADLGLWNVFANPDFPEVQAGLQQILPGLISLPSQTDHHVPIVSRNAFDDARILPLTIARFKTLTLRDLGQSQPYLHTGRKNTIEDVIHFYREYSNLARAGKARNIDPQIKLISLDDADVLPLSAFLKSLNEDYTD